MSGLYIHIPFCHSKCSYCDFYSLPMRIDQDSYVEAVLTEWKSRNDEVEKPYKTLYIGGGTPSILDADIFRKLINGLCIDMSGVVEFTVEANPEDVTPQWCAMITSLGVNRVSLGVQSFVDAELISVGRHHTSADALKAIATLKGAGITNISIDLIYGLPGQTVETWETSLSTCWDLRVPHVSAYTLTYEPGTRLYIQRQQGKIVEATDDTVIAMYRVLSEQAKAYGYQHYEISNFAFSGYEAKHNSSYWGGVQYLGLGPAAHSYTGTLRRWNLRDIRRYIANPITSYESEIIDDNTAYNDMVMTGLRTNKGVSPHSFNATELNLMHKYVSQGIMEMLPNGNCRILENQWLISDSIISDFFRVD